MAFGFQLIFETEHNQADTRPLKPGTCLSQPIGARCLVFW
jgi:hypothetical protein